MHKSLCLVAAGLLVIACGSSPTAPSPPTLTGAWLGPMTTSRGTVETRFNLSQSGAVVSGTWLITTAGNDTRGDVNGTFDGSAFAGSLTIDAVTGTGLHCLGVAGVTGPLNGRVLTLTSAGESLSNCTNPLLNITWTLTRQ
jgi:hypothetical protein